MNKFHNLPEKKRPVFLSKPKPQPKEKEFSIPQFNFKSGRTKAPARVAAKRRKKIMAKVYLYGLLIVLVSLFFLAIYVVFQEYVQTHTFTPQAPVLIKFQNPLIIERRKDFFISPRPKVGLINPTASKKKFADAAVIAPAPTYALLDITSTPVPIPKGILYIPYIPPHTSPTQEQRTEIDQKITAYISNEFGASHVQAMEAVFQRESGFNPWNVNDSSGACGLGQALPCSKLKAECPDLGNIDCQMKFWIGYVKGHGYGTPLIAWNTWQQKGWW